MRFIDEFKRIIEEGSFEIVGERIQGENGEEKRLCDYYKVTFQKEDDGWRCEVSQHFPDVLWHAGVTEPKNGDAVQKKVSSFLSSVRETSRSVAIAIDSNIVLSNQVKWLMGFMNRIIRRVFVYEKEATLVTTQAMEYEFHHQTESTYDKRQYLPSELQVGIPMRNYNGRGRLGAYGRFMHHVIMSRYPHLMIQTRLPPLLSVSKNSENVAYAEPSPTSPYFDIVILEQIREFNSISNAVVLFFSQDGDVCKIANQSGINAFYLERSKDTKISGLKLRQVFWVFVTMLQKNDAIRVKFGGNEERYMIVKNNRSKDVSLYIKQYKQNNYLSIHPDEKLF